ncbi:MAG: hypothetical protein AB7F85_08295 [Hyphomonadaceae bacterium]
MAVRSATGREAHDALNRVDQVQLNGSASGTNLIADYAYDVMSRRTGLTRGNGVTSRACSCASDRAGRGSAMSCLALRTPCYLFDRKNARPTARYSPTITIPAKITAHSNIKGIAATPIPGLM